MTLDLGAISGQFDELADAVGDDDVELGRIKLRQVFEDVDAGSLLARFSGARTSWLLARPEGVFQAAIQAPAVPRDYTVVASDGSFILPDRHTPARFYVINIGKVVLRYGTEPSADLSASPSMYFREHELFVPDNLRRIPVNGPVLGLKRATDELRIVAEIATAQQQPVLALQDGTLILWALESQPESVLNWVLEPYLKALRTMREARVPIAAYISYPGSNDVMNSLRVSICDYPERGLLVNCDHCRSRIESEGHAPACDVLPDVSDRLLFEQVSRLAPGERSQVFASTSKILRQYDQDLRIAFFYLNAGTEIARIEFPRWVADDPELLDFMHAALYEQCQLGRGYPSALQEAHELAAIRPDERRAVELMVEEALARHGVILRRSAKDGSKRGRFV